VLDLGESRSAIQREVASILEQLDGLDPSQWDRPTSLKGWRIVDLVRHLIWGQRLQALGWAQLRAGSSEVLVPDETTSTGRNELTAELSGAHDAFMAELAGVTATELTYGCPMPYGLLPGTVVLQIAVLEAGVHHYDLSSTVGGRPLLPDDVTTAGIAVVPGLLPFMGAASQRSAPAGWSYRLLADRLDIGIRSEGDGWTFGDVDEPTCAISGLDSTVILFLLGRLTASAADLTIEGARQQASAFKQFFPGP
jgi:uncharacterized protein (TIGR03083 family)